VRWATPECSVVLKERLVSEKYKQDSLGFLHYGSSVDASNLLRVDLPIFFSGH